MSLENEILSKIEGIMQYRRSKDPFYVELDRLYNEMFPIKQVQSVLKLGQAHAYAFIKNDIYKYLEKSDREIFDIIFEQLNKDEEMKDYINKLSK